jgi:hypothetical protein
MTMIGMMTVRDTDPVAAPLPSPSVAFISPDETGIVESCRA